MTESIQSIKEKIERAKAEYNKALGTLSALKEQAKQIPTVLEYLQDGEDLSVALKKSVQGLQKRVDELKMELDEKTEAFVNKYKDILGD